MVCVNCQFQDKFPSVVLNKDKEIQIEMGKKEAEVLRLRRRLEARRPRQTQCHYFNDESHVAAAGYDTVRAMCSVFSRVGTRQEGPLVVRKSTQPYSVCVSRPPPPTTQMWKMQTKGRRSGANCHLSNNAKNRDVDHRITQ